jgi:gamma-glutamylcyclotransferase
MRFLSLLAVVIVQTTFAMATTNNATVYFGYGSNLWKHQMVQRCPTSEYLGIARLDGYRWIINDRGYANVVEIPAKDSEKPKDEVWGLVYSLQSEDERRLDINEGVPIAYTKENITTEYWPAHNGSKPNTTDMPEEVKMLVYIDRNRTEPDVPKKEYIYRMNQGVHDAVKEGMPTRYVDEVIRKFIPAGEDESVKAFAHQQALLFEDEDE